VTKKCPVCHLEYVAEIPERISHDITLCRLYRHKDHGKVYLHHIRYW